MKKGARKETVGDLDFVNCNFSAKPTGKMYHSTFAALYLGFSICCKLTFHSKTKHYAVKTILYFSLGESLLFQGEVKGREVFSKIFHHISL